MTMFVDRADAGRRLAKELSFLQGKDVVVLGLPRGGVPVAFEVAAALKAPLDVIVVRKLGVPFQPEIAMGAIGEGGVRVLDAETLAQAGVTNDELAMVERRERADLESRLRRLRQGRPRVELAGRAAVIVDDGMATGATARAACKVARQSGATEVIVAVPVTSSAAARRLTEADKVISVAMPTPFVAVGAHYADFPQVSDDEVVSLLDMATRQNRHSEISGVVGDCVNTDVLIPVDGEVLRGHLYLPDNPTGVVLFAHGSGSSRHSPRNRYVAEFLQRAGLGTLLLDLLTPEEEQDRNVVFDIELLTARLSAATRWLRDRPEIEACSLGYFGASTGAAAALRACAEPDSVIRAVVSRGGRPDLAGDVLSQVRAPTLLIAGGDDDMVLDLNRRARTLMRCPTSFVVVPGATHLFEEPGALPEVARLAADWFKQYLALPRLMPESDRAAESKNRQGLSGHEGDVCRPLRHVSSWANLDDVDDDLLSDLLTEELAEELSDRLGVAIDMSDLRSRIGDAINELRGVVPIETLPSAVSELVCQRIAGEIGEAMTVKRPATDHRA